MNKKLILSLTALFVLSACAGKVNKPGELEPKTYKIGTAVTNEAVVYEAKDGKKAKFESNVTYVTVALDDKDAIAYVLIDEAQNAFEFDATSIEPFEGRKTKKELGNDYGLNWFEQVADLEKYVTGKTIAEIKAGDPASDLNSTVSISVDNFIATLEEAAANAVTYDNVVGIASSSSVNGTEDNGAVEIVTTVAAVATDKDGNVVYAFVDESQLKADIANGVATPTGSDFTKGQQKEEYGMSEKGMTEWYLQVPHLTDWAVGKNADAISKAAEDSDVTSTVTIYPGSFINTLVSALSKVK